MSNVCSRLFILPALLLAVAPAFADPGFPSGWGGGSRRMQDYDFGTAPLEDSNGGKAAYIRAKPDADRTLSFTMDQCVDAKDYAGKRLRLSGRLKTINADSGRLWMRINRGQFMVNSDYMSDRRLAGTNDWQNKEIVLNIPAGSTEICFGFVLGGGQGEVWARDLKLEPVSMNVRTTVADKGLRVGIGTDIVRSHGYEGRFDHH